MQIKLKLHKSTTAIGLLFSLLFVSLLISGNSNGQNGYTTSKSYSVKTIVIDAGHGGHDHGCSGSRSKEKEVVLDIALKLGKRIEQQISGVNVLYTRKSDRFVSLKQRAAFANRNNADLFISIHCNAGGKQAYGTETYVLGLHRNHDNLKVAMRENNSILLEDDYNQHYGSFDPSSPEAYIIFSLHQNAYLDQSLDLASLIERQFTEAAGRRSRGVKQAGFLVLRETSMPSVLIETGFLTNRTEESFLSSNSGKERIVGSIFTALQLYKKKLDAEAARIRAAKIKKQKEDEEARRRKTESEWAWPVMRDKHLHGEHYFIQLMVSAKYDKGASAFVGIDNMAMEYVERGKVWRYARGPYKTFEEAKKAQKDSQNKGFKDAFILKYVGQKRAK